MSNQHADFIRFFFTEKFLEIKKDLELVSRPHILQTFLIKNFLLFLYHAYVFDDVMKFRILKCQNLNISRTKSAFWNLLVVSKLISLQETDHVTNWKLPWNHLKSVLCYNALTFYFDTNFGLSFILIFCKGRKLSQGYRTLLSNCGYSRGSSLSYTDYNFFNFSLELVFISVF